MSNFKHVGNFMRTFGQEVKNNPEFPNEKIAKPIIQYAQNPDQNKILIIINKKLTKAQQKSTYFDGSNTNT